MHPLKPPLQLTKEATSLSHFVHDRGDLPAEKLGAAGGRMADVMGFHIQIHNLRGSNATEGHNLVAWKKIEKGLEHR